MVEEIEEYLKERFEFITIKVEYKQIKTYLIIIELKLNNTIIRSSFDYIWSNESTLNSNLSSIKYYVNKSIIKLFERSEK